MQTASFYLNSDCMRETGKKSEKQRDDYDEQGVSYVMVNSGVPCCPTWAD